MVSTKTIAALAMIAPMGFAVGQETGKGNALPKPVELLDELQREGSVPDQLVRDVERLVKVEADLRGGQQPKPDDVLRIYVAARKSLWEKFLRRLISSYRSMRRNGGDVSPATTKILLLTMPCMSSEQSLGGMVGDELTPEDYRKLADELLLAAKTTEAGLLGHLYKLHEGDRGARIRHAQLLGQVKPAADIATHLMEELEDEDVRVVQETITALGMIGTDAVQAIEKLNELSEHENKQIAGRAQAAVKQIKR